MRPQDPTIDNSAVQQKQLSPAIAYYIRKLLRQNLDQLTSIVAVGAGMKANPLSDLNAVIESLYLEPEEINPVVDQLSYLAMLHQTLSSQGAKHGQQLRNAGQEILWLLGFKLLETAQQGTVLIVDDVPLNVRLLSEAFTKQGYKTANVVDSGLAIKTARELQPDLILLDIMMPEIDGYEVCQRLKTDALTQDIPVIFVTTYNDAQSKVRAFAMGGADYITKPYQIEEVLTRSEHQITLRRLRLRLEEQNERMQAETQERQQAEDRYRSIVENSIDGIFQSAPTGHFIRANPALARIYGYESVEALLAGITNISQQVYVQSGRREGLLAYLQQHGQVSGAESEVYRKDGSTIWISENIRVVKDAKGNLLYYEGTVQDITDRRRMETELRNQRKKAELLLMGMLPRSVADLLKRDQSIMAERFEQATVLFADIHQFSEFSRHASPSEQINLLNRLFSAFDDLVEQHGVEKIKTLRDLYIVAAGVPSPQPNHATAIAEVALAMQQTANQFQAYLSEPLQLRIGISTGSVVAGVIGTKKFTYDLWGDTVDLANWMQLHATPGRIQVSPLTYEQLQHLFTFEEGKIIETPGLGYSMTYWLQGKK